MSDDQVPVLRKIKAVTWSALKSPLVLSTVRLVFLLTSFWVHRLTPHCAFCVSDLSALPSNAPSLALPNSAMSSTAIAYLIALIFFSLFFVMHIITLLPEFGVRMPEKITANTVASRVAAWIGVLGFIMMLMTAVVWRVSYGKDVDEFNAQIAQMGQNAPALAASVGNGFTSEYLFSLPPVLLTSHCQWHIVSSRTNTQFLNFNSDLGRFGIQCTVPHQRRVQDATQRRSGRGEFEGVSKPTGLAFYILPSLCCPRAAVGCCGPGELSKCTSNRPMSLYQ